MRYIQKKIQVGKNVIVCANAKIDEGAFSSVKPRAMEKPHCKYITCASLREQQQQIEEKKNYFPHNNHFSSFLIVKRQKKKNTWKQIARKFSIRVLRRFRVSKGHKIHPSHGAQRVCPPQVEHSLLKPSIFASIS